MSQSEHAADGAQSDAAGQGPPAELPDPVPEFVGEIHAAIGDFLGGGAETLGDIVSGIASSVDVGEAAATVADAAAVVPL